MDYATVLLLGAMRLVWYGFSGFYVLSSILLNWWSGLATLYNGNNWHIIISKSSCTLRSNPYPLATLFLSDSDFERSH